MSKYAITRSAVPAAADVIIAASEVRLSGCGESVPLAFPEAAGYRPDSRNRPGYLFRAGLPPPKQLNLPHLYVKIKEKRNPGRCPA